MLILRSPSRELYTGTEECHYNVGPKLYRVLVGIGTFLFMLSIVLLGNCDFPMQAAIGGSYMLLNGALWLVSLLHKDWFWDLSLYVVRDITPSDALHADLTFPGTRNEDRENVASFTRTLWYAIRETKKTGWMRKMGAAPATAEWDEWLKEAEREARNGNRGWKAVERRVELSDGGTAGEDGDIVEHDTLVTR